MGAKQRPRLQKLPKKIFQIRESFGISQDDFIDRLGMKDSIVRSTISQWERGEREPSYIALLAISKLAGVCCDYLIDDSLDLPENLPAKIKHKK